MNNTCLNTSIDNIYERWLVFDFEKSFNYYEKRTFLRQNLHIPIAINAVYLATVFGIRKLMQNRDPFSLKKAMIAWNLSLALFSIAGSFRVLPFFLYHLKKGGFHDTCCIEPMVNGPYGFWCMLFVASKIPELGDSIFVVLRKQKLIFLHWFHHSSVLLFVWIANSDDFSIGGFFIVMNFLVHSFMYTYYTLKSLGFRLPRSFAMAITFSQLLQMMIGLYVTLYLYNEKLNNRPCATSDLTTFVSLFLYGMYLILFFNFFLRSYFQSINLRKANVFCKTVLSVCRPVDRDGCDPVSNNNEFQMKIKSL